MIDSQEQIEKFKEFIQSNYQNELYEIVREGKKSLIIDFSDLAKFDPELSEQLLNEPEETIKAAELSLTEFDLPEDINFRIRFKNLPKSQEIMVRDIRSANIGKLMAIEGIVRQSSDVRPQVVSARFECPACGNTISMLQLDTKFKEPGRCSCGRRGHFRLLSKDLVDAQRLVVEEIPESLVGGEQPKRLSVFLKEDLVEPKMEQKTTPGSKIKVNGLIKEVPVMLKTGVQSIRYDLMAEANHIEPMEETYYEIKISKKDEDEIKKLAKDPKVYEKFINSIAPSIYGHEDVKEALVLQLMGGVKKEKKDGTVIRGDMHILLVGDPGCLVADERVVLGNGSIVKISELGKEHLQEINTQILTGEGRKKRDFAKVFHFYKRQPIMEIITETGKSIKGTYNHPLLCLSNKNGTLVREWKRLDEFKIGDKIAVTTSIPCTITRQVQTNFKPLNRKFGPRFKGKLPKYVDTEFASILGYLLGDGWITKYRIGFVIAEPEKDILKKLVKMCNSLFCIKPRLEERKILLGRKIRLYNLIINSIDIANNIKFLKEKRVPSIILKSGNKVVSSFLRWLYEADGSVFDKGRGRRAISLKAKNIEMLRDVQILILRFGIHSRIIENSLMIRRGEAMIKFAKEIGFVSKKKKKILKKLVLDAKSFKRLGSQRSEKIVKIIYHKMSEDVFDIEVPTSARFIANGIISHNTAKSSLLMAISKTAPKARFVAGRSATAAGITATIVKDEFLRGWALEAGAVVLCNKGILMVDEMDKMSVEDTSALHEAMEQQRITISKANIQATLRAETTILAAANPKLGRFDPYSPIAGQIAMPPTLINRFDLIFPIRDLPDKIMDEKIAKHVLAIQQAPEIVQSEIPVELIKKYISYVKQNINPKLSESALEEIKSFYVNLRNTAAAGEEGLKPIPVTARQLEALVRLAEGSARIRLSNTVTKVDAIRAIRLLRNCLMQVGFDYETGQIDIDRISTGIPTSQRSKIVLVREIINELDSRGKKTIPIEEIIAGAADKNITEAQVEEIIEKMKRSGDLFEPKRGFISKI